MTGRHRPCGFRFDGVVCVLAADHVGRHMSRAERDEWRGRAPLTAADKRY